MILTHSDIEEIIDTLDSLEKAREVENPEVTYAEVLQLTLGLPDSEREWAWQIIINLAAMACMHQADDPAFVPVECVFRGMQVGRQVGLMIAERMPRDD